jgi:hypothetical protein
MLGLGFRVGVMSQHSAGQDRQEEPILGDTQISVGPSNAILEPMHDASCRGPAALAQRRGDLAPTVEPAQPDLPADHEAEERDERYVLSGQRALGLHAPAELLIQAFDHVGIRYESGRSDFGGYPGMALRARRDPGANTRCVIARRRLRYGEGAGTGALGSTQDGQAAHVP